MNKIVKALTLTSPMLGSTSLIFSSRLFIILLIQSLEIVGQDKAITQEQSGEAPFSYEVVGLVYVSRYDVANRTPTDEVKIPKPPLRFEIVRRDINKNRQDILILKFLDITKDNVFQGGQVVSLTQNQTFVNSSDNDKYFWITQDELDRLLTNKTIKISYKLTYKLTYGANISIPFKLRPKIDTTNFKLTPEISLTGYIGMKKRISRSKAYYATFPILSLGLATLPISNETDGTIQDNGDGLVLGITASTGIVFELNDFQLGLLVGWDKAAGQLGKYWIYNGRPWYSFSIGYSFLGRKDDIKQK